MLPGNGTMDSQECQLLTGANRTAAPTIAAHGTAEGVDPLLVSGECAFAEFGSEG